MDDNHDILRSASVRTGFQPLKTDRRRCAAGASKDPGDDDVRRVREAISLLHRAHPRRKLGGPADVERLSTCTDSCIAHEHDRNGYHCIGAEHKHAANDRPTIAPAYPLSGGGLPHFGQTSNVRTVA